MRTFVFLITLFWCTSVHAQSFREIFTEANLLTEDGLYGLAIPFWDAILADNPNNANVNYKLGRSYLGLGVDRDQALPYLIAASKDVRKNYDPFSSGFEGAPTETYYYLAQAYHIAGNLDSAEINYQQFLDDAGKKHFLRPAAERGLKMCEVARELMAHPVEVTITNIGTPINSPYAEYSPIVAFDENALYYTSRRLREDRSNDRSVEAETGLYYEDMYVSFKNLQGGWMNPELLNINIPNAHSSVVSMSHDGQRLYTYKSVRGNGNLYVSEFQIGHGWTDPTLLGSDINSKHNEYYATITADGQRLYFVSDRPGGLGGKDIWYCNKLPNGAWGKAINAGEPINTIFDEDAPFIHPSGKTMFFASNGHRSMGGYDIFQTTLTNDGWRQPENLGYPINTTDDDHSYITTPSGNRAYYSSKGTGTLGSTDIYVIEYPEEENKPRIDMSGFAVLKGWVLSGRDSLPSDFKIYLSNSETGKMTGEATPVARNGSFVFIIPSGHSYEVDYTLDDDTLISEVIEIAEGEQYKELQREIILSADKNGSMEAVVLDESVLNPAKSGRLTIGKQGIVPVGSKIFYLDDNDQVLHTVYVSKDGFFEFKELASSQSMIIKAEVPGVSNDELNVAFKRGKAEDSIQLVSYKDKFIDKRLVENVSDQNDAGNPEEIAKANHTSNSEVTKEDKPLLTAGGVYRFTFGYNATSLKSSDREYQALVEEVILRVSEAEGPVKVFIEGSASSVPTASFESNIQLAEARAKAAQKQLISSLESRGIDTNKMLTFELQSGVNGPAYDESTKGKKYLFSDFQFVKFNLN